MFVFAVFCSDVALSFVASSGVDFVFISLELAVLFAFLFAADCLFTLIT